MNISQFSDAQIIDWIESARNYSDGNELNYELSINEVFVVQVSVAAKEIIEHLRDNEKIAIRLFYYKDPPPIEETQIDPMEFEYVESNGNIKKYKVEFDINIFPHITIFPKNEEHFKSQSWSKSFINNLAVLQWHDICDIIRYCDKISKLKLFW